MMQYLQLAVLLTLTLFTGALLAVTVIRRREPPDGTPLEVVAPVSMAMVPIAVSWRPRLVAAARRFAKVFAFVLLGLVAASLTTPEGLAALLQPQALIVLVLASTVGAVLKYVAWTDVTAEAPPTVTLAVTPKTPAAETPLE